VLPIPRGVPFVTQFRPERMEAIGKALAKGDYDIVLLQEVGFVWCHDSD
jgi:hypothetical protein